MSSEREKFAQRLNDSLDNINYPTIGHGRQSALAKELDLSAQVVGSWLKGDDFPKTSQLVKVSRFLDVRSNWLLSGVGSKIPEKDEERECRRLGPRLDKEAFNIALIWMKLPPEQRMVLKKVIEGLVAAEKPRVSEDLIENN